MLATICVITAGFLICLKRGQPKMPKIGDQIDYVSPYRTGTIASTEEAPRVVSIKKARELLADKSRSEIYQAVADGRLEALKDGRRTLITMESIERYNKSLPRATIKKYIRRAR
jgi:hypothetical protein